MPSLWLALAGRWRGARVAVKIIEHSPDVNSKIEAFRENMVACNIQHPNVVRARSAPGLVLCCG
jgi:hypothetical protein